MYIKECKSSLTNGGPSFCSQRKSRKSEEAQKLINVINAVCPISNMKACKQYTGSVFPYTYV